MNKIQLRKRIIIAILVIVAGLVAGGIVNMIRDTKTMHISLEDGVTNVNVYPDLGTGQPYNYNSKNKPVATITVSGSVKLHTGTYDFVISGNTASQFANPVSQIDVTRATTAITINPLLASAQLTKLLQTKQAAIHQALSTNYPTLSQYYTISNEALYRHGDWYGAVLTPSNPTVDTLRLVMHQTDTSWSIAAKPQVSIGAPSNPNIPTDVLTAIDILGL